MTKLIARLADRPTFMPLELTDPIDLAAASEGFCPPSIHNPMRPEKIGPKVEPQPDGTILCPQSGILMTWEWVNDA